MREKSSSPGAPLGSDVRKFLDARLIGAAPTRRCTVLKAAAEDLNATIRECGMLPSSVDALGRLIDYMKDRDHHFTQGWQFNFGVWAGVIQPVDVRHAEPEVIEVESEPPVPRDKEPVAEPESEAHQSGMSLVPVSFHGDTLEAVRSGSSVMVSVRRVCEALGLNPDGQRVKLKECGWACTEIISARDSLGRNQEVFCIDLESLPMWLAGINLGKVSPEIHPKLLAYQKECKAALASHFGMGQQTTGFQSIDTDSLMRGITAAVSTAMAAAMTTTLPLIAATFAQAGKRQRLSDPPVDTRQQPLPNMPPKAPVVQLDAYGHPRIAAFPSPNTVANENIFSSLVNMINIHSEVTGNFEATHLLAYDEICRTVDPGLTKRKYPKSGERIGHIKSMDHQYQRRCLEAAYRVLIAPNLKSRSRGVR